MLFFFVAAAHIVIGFLSREIITLASLDRLALMERKWDLSQNMTKTHAVIHT